TLRDQAANRELSERAALLTAFCWFKLEKWPKAEAAFLQLIDINPNGPLAAEGYYHLGLIRSRAGNPEGAARAWSILIHEFPQTAWAETARKTGAVESPGN
ncbi:MAG: tetratricopeptide repeat protein, partial [Deltaproteobacteria bacterium]|nr:tetratricopeptide repeat protein [Deltaproteobacteria bacterium]